MLLVRSFYSNRQMKFQGEVWEDQSMEDWPDNDYRIFCGNLGNEVTDEMLALSFRKYPSFNRAKVKFKENKIYRFRL